MKEAATKKSRARGRPTKNQKLQGGPNEQDQLQELKGIVHNLGKLEQAYGDAARSLLRLINVCEETGSLPPTNLYKLANASLTLTTGLESSEASESIAGSQAPSVHAEHENGIQYENGILHENGVTQQIDQLKVETVEKLRIRRTKTKAPSQRAVNIEDAALITKKFSAYVERRRVLEPGLKVKSIIDEVRGFMSHEPQIKFDTAIYTYLRGERLPSSPIIVDALQQWTFKEIEARGELEI